MPLVPTLETSITSALSAITTSETVLVTQTVPTKFLQAGSVVRFVIAGTCTCGGASTNTTFMFRAGTAGTTADTDIQKWVVTNSTSGTVDFRAVVDVTIRTSGASGTTAGVLDIVNASASAGIVAASGTAAVQTTQDNNIDTTSATKLSLTLVSGNAATSIVVKLARCEILPV